MPSDSGLSSVHIEVLLDLEDCLLSEALLKSLVPESSLRLRSVVFDVSRVDCSLKLVFRGSELGALIPPFMNSLRLISLVIEVLKSLTEVSR